MIKVIKPTKATVDELVEAACSVLKAESNLIVVWTPHLIIKCTFQSFSKEKGESKTILNSFFMRPELSIESALSLFRPNLLKFKIIQLEESSLVDSFRELNHHVCESMPVNLDVLVNEINARISIIQELLPRARREVLKEFRRSIFNMFFPISPRSGDYGKLQYSSLMADELLIKLALNLPSLPERVDLKAVGEVYVPYLLISSKNKYKFLFLVKTGGLIKKFREDVVLSRIVNENECLRKYFKEISTALS